MSKLQAFADVDAAPSTKPKVQKEKTLTCKEWTIENVIEDLKIEADKASKGRQCLTVPQTAFKYWMSQSEFEAECYKHDETAKWLHIYERLYLDQVVNKALEKGSLNKETGDYLRQVVQTFADAGTNQHVNWTIDYAPIKLSTGEEIEIEYDAEYSHEDEKEKAIWDGVEE